MHRPRVILGAGASLVLVTSSFLACSSDSRPQGAGDVTEAGVDEATVADEAAATPPAGYDGGVGIGLFDVADTPCSPRGGPLAVVLPGADASPPPPAFRSLQRIGERRVADAVDGSGFVVFGADGTGAARVASAPLGRAATTVFGSQIVLGGRSGQGFDRAIVQTFDPNGATVGASVVLANEYPDSVGIVAAGADDKASLIVWTTGAGVRARGFAAGAAAGDGAYTLAVTSKLHDPSLAVSSVQSGLFAVAFSGNDGGSFYQTAFGRGSTTTRIGDPSNLFSGEVARTVVGLARTPSGFALLVTVNDGVNPYAMLVLTDAGGRRQGAGLKLLGTIGASALAVKDSEIGVLAQRREGTAFESKVAPEFRAFDLSGAPIAPWVCVEPPSPSTARVAGGGVVAESNGYSALFLAADGSTSLARFDHVGTGAP